MLIELWQGGRVVVAFDGRVLEQFGAGAREGSKRWHVVELESGVVETDRKGRTFLRGQAANGGFFGCELEDRSEASAVQMLAEIDRVRVESYGLGPVTG